MLSDEEAIDNVNPFVMHDFSLPGGVRQTGSFEDFSEMRSEPGIGEPTRSVYCDYGLCAESTSACSYLDHYTHAVTLIWGIRGTIEVSLTEFVSVSRTIQRFLSLGRSLSHSSFFRLYITQDVKKVLKPRCIKGLLYEVR